MVCLFEEMTHASKFSRYKVSAGLDLFTSVGFCIPNELCGRGSVENFTKKLRILFKKENKLTSFLYAKLDQRQCQNKGESKIVFLVKFW